jgi:hypothetical protein
MSGSEQASGFHKSGSSGSYAQVWKWALLVVICCCCSIPFVGSAAYTVFAEQSPSKPSRSARNRKASKLKKQKLPDPPPKQEETKLDVPIDEKKSEKSEAEPVSEGRVPVVTPVPGSGRQMLEPLTPSLPSDPEVPLLTPMTPTGESSMRITPGLESVSDTVIPLVTESSMIPSFSVVGTAPSYSSPFIFNTSPSFSPSYTNSYTAPSYSSPYGVPTYTSSFAVPSYSNSFTASTYASTSPYAAYGNVNPYGVNSGGVV